MTMTKAELVDAVAVSTGETKKAVAVVIEATLAAIKVADKVSLVGFGTFTKKMRAARTGRNPATNQPMNIPAKLAFTFKASKA